MAQGNPTKYYCSREINSQKGPKTKQLKSEAIPDPMRALAPNHPPRRRPILELPCLPNTKQKSSKQSWEDGSGKRKAAVNQIIESKLEDYPGERDEYAPLFLPRELRPPRRQRFGFLQRREDRASGVRG